MKLINSILTILTFTTLAFADQKPSYTLDSKEIIGTYTNPSNKTDKAEVIKNKQKITVNFPDEGVEAVVYEKEGKLLFSTGVLDSGECDDPGCRVLVKITGIIYPKEIKNQWVPTVKATFVHNYLHPEYDGDSEGEEKTTEHYFKK
ncbi:MAG: hypothetical protein AAB116_09760 [Candidatus Poribacteria bacterium]